jgi:outer membrane protein OmpA-like peptidoglycan-associated protein
VTLTYSTVIQAVSGVVGLRKEDHPASDLIKGLAVNIETVQNGSEVDATKVTFKPADLKTATAVQAGVAEGKEKILAAQAENERVQAEHQRRIAMVGQFSEKGNTKVFFASGSVAINEKGKQDLQAIAKQAEEVPGYILRVVGHADTTGNAAANQRLSDQRASVVTAYLLKNCGVPKEKMGSSSGLGATSPVDDDDPSMGLAQSRRVTVFILVSKASEGMSTSPK